MEKSFSQPAGLDKASKYELFLDDYKTFIEGETDHISLMANTSAALREAFGFFWVGFYFVFDNQWLHLGPFQGPTACARIKYGRGVCGSAWQQAQTLVVPDVDKFPGHIACSSDSRSEIVVPLIKSDGTIVGVLDIDSDRLEEFDETDRQGLEKMVSALMQQW